MGVEVRAGRIEGLPAIKRLRKNAVDVDLGLELSLVCESEDEVPVRQVPLMVIDRFAHDPEADEIEPAAGLPPNLAEDGARDIPDVRAGDESVIGPEAGAQVFVCGISDPVPAPVIVAQVEGVAAERRFALPEILRRLERIIGFSGSMAFNARFN